MELIQLLMRKRQNCNSVVFFKRAQNGQNRAVGWTGGAGAGFSYFFREREHLLSRIPADRIVCSRRSKKESCSTRRGLRVGTDLVEFRQLQEVGIFSYLR